MSINAIGTIIKIIFITITLISFWFFGVAFSYFIVCLLFNIEFNISTFWILFAIVIFIRMFYPKNVFL
jgi:hypothetical protein